MSKQNKGFTLMELMVTVAIIGILASIAIPSYRQYVLRGNRADMQAQMLVIAAALERYKAQNFRYQGATLSNTGIYGASVYPQQGQAHYTLTLTGDNTDGTPNLTWTLKAQATSNTQKQDGVLMLNSAGQRCWLQGAATTTCTLGDAAQGWN
ncbi:MAG TPA: type IV pilin protein [Agitococcus sp.]|nr:type IV pilin protein [Agitococcus sp.]HMV60030.1 type IV pilin protein [Agitococcus sp.]HMX98669.1 type IV pilin protein [Agitococcus sp.]HMY82699.1 type IV pilin protein [Agitococcus sp.]HNA20716.1 type IV pilin protein [Agitococcus sp.]